ncbi:MAG: radical SAM protein [Proteobacteria bacterium]|nr:MAG: radical SAM protein [Pseudomonadota bacterium]
MPDFDARLRAHGLAPLRRSAVTTLQLQIGRRCDLACTHCHVEAGPKRTEAMDRAGVERVLHLLRRNPAVSLLDVTGGAPELHPEFRFLVAEARALGRRVIDRCNLTVLLEPGQEDTAAFLAAHGVEIVASLPCYEAPNVDRQRGRGVYARSVEALRRLNALGYGRGLRLDLVYNPQGASLPPPQAELEARYRDELRARHGIEFDHLLVLANMPVRRFASALARDRQYERYLALLGAHFNPATVPGLMCRTLLSIAWDGRVYDCDFHQMQELPPTGPVRTIWDADDLAVLAGAPIATAPHCFGCTAGAGSSCGGALVQEADPKGIGSPGRRGIAANCVALLAP